MKSVLTDLSSRDLKFALAGGLLASVYRASPRATNDIDILIMTEGNHRAVAEEIIQKHGLKPHLLRKADLEGGPNFAIKRKSSPVSIVAGRGAEIGLDFLLPEFPWAVKACERAQYNNINYGFGPVPSLSIEDFVISKLYALKNQSTRFMDLDDLKSVFMGKHKMDHSYLCAELTSLKLKIPVTLQSFLPKELA